MNVDEIEVADAASSAVEQPDFLSMSDEDMLNMDFPEPEVPEEAVADEVEPEGEELIEDEDLSEEELEEDEVLEEEGSELDSDVDGTPDGDLDVEEDTTNNDSNEIDYKSKYEELLAPFKGNGKEIKVETPEDLRRLAQMGVGYNAKMAALKPVRKIAKMLENEGLLDESKINYLIDLSKNNPDAINKLVKDSGINPLDLDTESTEGYKPNTYTVDDKQLDLDEALNDLEQSTSGQRVIDVVSTKWDENSKRVLVGNPAMLRDLEQHINDGIYDKVMSNLERERLLGRIPAGVSDLEAYNFIGQQMHAAGAFNSPATTAPEAKEVSKPKDTKRNSRRRAAATTRSKPATTKTPPKDILNLSDEEFEKLMPNYV